MVKRLSLALLGALCLCAFDSSAAPPPSGPHVAEALTFPRGEPDSTGADTLGTERFGHNGRTSVMAIPAGAETEAVLRVSRAREARPSPSPSFPGSFGFAVSEPRLVLVSEPDLGETFAVPPFRRIPDPERFNRRGRMLYPDHISESGLGSASVVTPSPRANYTGPAFGLGVGLAWIALAAMFYLTARKPAHLADS